MMHYRHWKKIILLRMQKIKLLRIYTDSNNTLNNSVWNETILALFYGVGLMLKDKKFRNKRGNIPLKNI